MLLRAAQLRAASKPTLFLNLVHRALRADDDARRVSAFAKRMLQVTNASR